LQFGPCEKRPCEPATASGDRAGQDPSGSNSVDQTAQAKAVTINTSPNVAFLNYGGVNQSSSSSAAAGAPNWNQSSQENDQKQSGPSRDSGCYSDCGKDGCGEDGCDGSCRPSHREPQCDKRCEDSCRPSDCKPKCDQRCEPAETRAAWAACPRGPSRPAPNLRRA